MSVVTLRSSFFVSMLDGKPPFGTMGRIMASAGNIAGTGSKHTAKSRHCDFLIDAADAGEIDCAVPGGVLVRRNKNVVP